VHLKSARWTSCILSPHGRSRAFCASTEGKPFAAPHASCWDASWATMSLRTNTICILDSPSDFGIFWPLPSGP
jgi:hypothetical protein